MNYAKILHAMLIMALLNVSGMVQAAEEISPIAQLVPFQGRLHDGGGSVVADGIYNLSFYIYETPTNGTFLWEENHAQVSVINGYINVLLGAITDFKSGKSPVDFSKKKYLSISINGGQEMFPRHQLVPSFHAYDAKKLGGKDANTYAQVDYVNNKFKETNEDVDLLKENLKTALVDRFVKSDDDDTITNQAKEAAYADKAGNADKLNDIDAEHYARTNVHETFGNDITVEGDVSTGSKNGGSSWHHFYDDHNREWRSLGWDKNENKFMMENSGGKFFPLGVGVKTLHTGNIREYALREGEVKKGIYYVVHSGDTRRYTATIFVDDTTSIHLGVGGDHHVYFDGKNKVIGTEWGNVKAIYFVEIPNGF